MVCRVLAVTCLVGCGFQPSPLHTGSPDAAKAHDAPTADSPSGGGPDGSTPDAAATAPDAAPDAPSTTTGSIAITTTTEGSSDLDLTALGTKDWAHWGDGSRTSFDHKAGGSGIGPLATTPAASFSGAPLTASWSDGTPLASESMTSTGVLATQGNSFQLSVAADKTPHTLLLYVGAQEADARLDVSLSDSSAGAQSETLASASKTTNVLYTITYNAASPGAMLSVTWTDTQDHNQGNAFAALLSAALQ